MGTFKKDIKSQWESQMETILKPPKNTDMESFLSLIAIAMNNRHDKNIAKMYNIVHNIEIFSDIMNAFSGMTVTFPNREDFKETILLGLSYYYKEMKGMNWDQIKKEMPFDNILPIKAERALLKLEKSIKSSIEELMNTKEETL
jgi:hypothetical protein